MFFGGCCLLVFETSSSFYRENESSKTKSQKTKMDQFLTYKKAKIGLVFNSTAYHFFQTSCFSFLFHSLFFCFLFLFCLSSCVFSSFLSSFFSSFFTLLALFFLSLSSFSCFHLKGREIKKQKEQKERKKERKRKEGGGRRKRKKTLEKKQGF